MELYHHGVLGMKWGVRRYQNKDGSLTSAGRKHYNYRDRAVRAGKTKGDVESIIKSMNKEDRDNLLAGSDHYLTIEEGSAVCKRVLKRIGDKPVAFLDLIEQDKDTLQVALGTRSGKKYRGKGYGSEVAKTGMEWINKNIDKIGQKQVVWNVNVNNKSSARIAKKNGFKIDESSYSDDKQWVNYVRKLR